MDPVKTELKTEAQDEGPEAAYAQSDLYADVMQDTATTNGQVAAPTVTTPMVMEYKSYTTVHPKSMEQQEKESKIAANVENHQRGKQLYVGGLTWWTTDEELGNAIKECGVTDLINVKFFENRINGQSKGFALVEVGSESSQKLISDTLASKILNNQKPVVTYVNKQTLTMFEAQARKDIPGLAASEKREANNYQPKSKPQQPVVNVGPQIIHGFPPPGANVVNGPPPFMDPNLLQHHHHHQQQQQQHHHHQQPPPMHLHPGQIPQGAIIVDAAGNIIQGGMHGAQLPPGMIPQVSVAGPMHQLPPRPGVAPHINPAFINQEGQQPVDPMTGVPLQTAGLNQQDMESMRRNQAVASTAIQRAMTDANAGEFESGIETLVTAISLIKQSTTANTEPAQVLVQSLQDCLHGLEGQLVQKGAGHRSSGGGNRYGNDEFREADKGDRRRRRDRSRSRSRDRRRSSFSPKRSRSRERRRR